MDSIIVWTIDDIIWIVGSVAVLAVCGTWLLIRWIREKIQDRKRKQKWK